MKQRTIKFRVLDRKHNTFDFYTLEELIQFDNSENLYYPSGFETQQFTGLLDKNGKEIYEGDIVKFNIGGNNKSNGDIFIVRFGQYCNELNEEQGNGWYVVTAETPDSTTYGTRQLWTGEFYEIIGNIFENPELIKFCGKE